MSVSVCVRACVRVCIEWSGYRKEKKEQKTSVEIKHLIF